MGPVVKMQEEVGAALPPRSKDIKPIHSLFLAPVEFPFVLTFYNKHDGKDAVITRVFGPTESVDCSIWRACVAYPAFEIDGQGKKLYSRSTLCLAIDNARRFLSEDEGVNIRVVHFTSDGAMIVP